MDRNWLIRTTQNQILGPVAKSKVLEFLEKGALGKDDEVASGNGYWFSLREKELVDKYLFGDIPQGYNPISESKSVLAKRENPEKTTSINTAPANSTQDKNKSHSTTGVSPKDEDLEYPDSTSDITMVGVSLNNLIQKPAADKTKLPAMADLEYPDMSIVANNSKTNSEHKTSQIHLESPESKAKTSAQKSSLKVEQEITNSNNFKYPEESNLEFPDLVAVSQQTVTIAIKNESLQSEAAIVEEEDRDFTVLLAAAAEAAKPVVEKKNEKSPSEKRQIESLIGPIIKEKKTAKPIPTAKPIEERKLLHDRKKHSTTDHHEAEKSQVAKRPVVNEELKSRNDNYLLYLIILLVIIIVALFVYYYVNILNKPFPV